MCMKICIFAPYNKAFVYLFSYFDIYRWSLEMVPEVKPTKISYAEQRKQQAAVSSEQPISR